VSKPKLVPGENVSQALQFVESGAAAAGPPPSSRPCATRPLARPLLGDTGKRVSPHESGGIILKDTQPARDFRSFLLAEAGRRILKQYRFFVPEE